MAAPGQSLLLQCLTKLNDDAWAEVLLPKLVQQKSARDVAASCTQLRDLCFSAVQDVVLADTYYDTDTDMLQDWIAPLPQHFCNSTSLQLTVGIKQDFQKAPHMLPAIAKLPKLSTLLLGMLTPPQPVPLAMLLSSIRSCLTSLQGLSLEFGKPWPKACGVWQEVALFSQLTSLTVQYNSREAGQPLGCNDLALLSKLCRLQVFHLGPSVPSIEGLGIAQQQPLPAASAANGEWLQCLKGMTALTGLLVEVPQFSGLQHISACSSIESLYLGSVGEGPLLTEQHWAAVGHLTKLTALSVYTPKAGAASTACYDALRKLTRLQVLGGMGWTAEALPVFRDLTTLTVLVGDWLPAPDSFVGDAVTCDSVQHLIGLAGPVPFAAFPNLKVVSHYGTLPLESVAELQQCQHLEEFWADTVQISYWGRHERTDVSLPPEEPLTARVAAVKAFGKLDKLSVLGLKPSDNVELAAFAEVVQKLRGKALRHAGLSIKSNSSVDSYGLMQLGQLHGLPQLDVTLPHADDDTLADPASFLCALNGVGYLLVGVPQEHHAALLREAVKDLQAVGLAVSSSVEIQNLSQVLNLIQEA